MIVEKKNRHFHEGGGPSKTNIGSTKKRCFWRKESLKKTVFLVDIQRSLNIHTLNFTIIYTRYTMLF